MMVTIRMPGCSTGSSPQLSAHSAQSTSKELVIHYSQMSFSAEELSSQLFPRSVSTTDWSYLIKACYNATCLKSLKTSHTW